MPLRPCLGRPGEPCGRLTDAPGSRCEACCSWVLQDKRTRRPRISVAEERRRATAVRMWRAKHGDVCPGWGRPEHGATDLTADHVVAVGAGGAEGGVLAVLCRSCNGTKADHIA